jgi:hypothetical protein
MLLLLLLLYRLDVELLLLDLPFFFCWCSRSPAVAGGHAREGWGKRKGSEGVQRARCAFFAHADHIEWVVVVTAIASPKTNKFTNQPTKVGNSIASLAFVFSLNVSATEQQSRSLLYVGQRMVSPNTQLLLMVLLCWCEQPGKLFSFRCFLHRNGHEKCCSYFFFKCLKGFARGAQRAVLY